MGPFRSAAAYPRLSLALPGAGDVYSGAAHLSEQERHSTI